MKGKIHVSPFVVKHSSKLVLGFAVGIMKDEIVVIVVCDVVVDDVVVGTDDGTAVAVEVVI